MEGEERAAIRARLEAEERQRMGAGISSIQVAKAQATPVPEKAPSSIPRGAKSVESPATVQAKVQWHARGCRVTQCRRWRTARRG